MIRLYLAAVGVTLATAVVFSAPGRIVRVRRARTGDGERVVIVPALLWAEAVAARMRLAAAAGIAGGGE